MSHVAPARSFTGCAASCSDKMLVAPASITMLTGCSHIKITLRWSRLPGPSQGAEIVNMKGSR